VALISEALVGAEPMMADLQSGIEGQKRWKKAA
jgi:hypothetical protein